MSNVTYRAADGAYFEKRGLRRHARVWSLWALGVGAVISGQRLILSPEEQFALSAAGKQA